MPPDPPDGRDLMAHEAGYKQLLASVDLFVSTMVPGQRMRIKPGQIVRASGIAADTNAAQFQARYRGRRRQASEGKAGLQPDHRPADLYLNGECTDANGYYIEQNDLAAL